MEAFISDYDSSAEFSSDYREINKDYSLFNVLASNETPTAKLSSMMEKINVKWK